MKTLASGVTNSKRYLVEGGDMKRDINLPLLISLPFLIVLILPIFYLIFGSIFFSIGGEIFTWETFIKYITSPKIHILLANTLIYGIGSAALGTILGMIYAWIIVRTDVPGKKILRHIPILGLTIPLLVKCFAWVALFSPKIGLVNLFFQQLFNTASLFNIYGLGGMIFANGVGGFSLAYLVIEPALNSLDPSLEEASRATGSGTIRTLFKVTVPILLPAVFSAFLLLMIMSIENFDYPFVLGYSVGVRTLATELYYLVLERSPPNYGGAAIISTIFLIITVLIFSLYIWITRKAYRFVVVTGKAPRQTVNKLGKWKYVALAVCILILLFNFGLIFAATILLSLSSYISLPGGNITIKFTLNNFAEAIQLPFFDTALINSITFALASAIIATLIASVIAYTTLKSRVGATRLLDYISNIPLAFPGIVYGLALFWTFLLIPGGHIIYGTIWPLVICFTIIRLPQSIRIISGNLIEIGNELEEASHVCGASWVTTFRNITLPLLKWGLLNSFRYIFVNSLRELGSVIFLVTPESMVLMVLLLNYYANHALALNKIAAVALIIIAITIIMEVAIPLAQRLSTKRLKSRKE